MVRSTYLDYPENAEAYTFDQQYLYGSDVLVAPVTKAGAGSVDTSVFLRSGGIVPTRMDYVDSANAKPLDQVTLDVAAGAVGARVGSYPGAVASRTWTVRFRNVGAAAQATVNGAQVPSTYDAATRTLTVKTDTLPVSGQTVVAYTP